MALGFLVERVTGMPLDRYAETTIFARCMMDTTRFLPPAAWLPRIAPTQYDEHDTMLRGVVHDPTARRMGGVAGHAGCILHGRRSGQIRASDLLNGCSMFFAR